MFDGLIGSLRALHHIVYVKVGHGPGLLSWAQEKLVKHPCFVLSGRAGKLDPTEPVYRGVNFGKTKDISGWTDLATYIKTLQRPYAVPREEMGVSDLSAIREAVARDSKDDVDLFLVPDGDVVLRDIEVQRALTRFGEQRTENINMVKTMILFGAGPLPDVYPGLKQYLTYVDETESDEQASAARLQEAAVQLRVELEDLPATLAAIKGMTVAQVDRAIADAVIRQKRLWRRENDGKTNIETPPRGPLEVSHFLISRAEYGLT